MNLTAKEQRAINAGGIGHGGLPTVDGWTITPDNAGNGLGYGGFGTGPDYRHSGGVSLYKVILLACLFLIAYLFIQPVHAACSGDGSAWSWDNVEGKSCAPCNFTGTLQADHKLHDSCSTPVYVGFRVTWNKQTAASQYELELNRNDAGWGWLHTASGSDPGSADFLFTDTLIGEGDGFCVRLRAGNGADWSGYSESACTSVPVVAMADTLQSPGTIRVQLY